MKLEILKPWRKHKVGAKVDVPAHTAAGLIGTGTARKVTEPKPAPPAEDTDTE